MGSTFLSLHFHIVFSTKERRPLIAPEWRGRLHEYLGGIVRRLGGVPEAIGRVADHVHLLVGLKAPHTLADFVRELKKAATNWVQEHKLEPMFSWQEGYAAFTVSPNARGGVKGYIARQEEHHRQRSYLEELRELLDKAEIEVDPRYLE